MPEVNLLKETQGPDEIRRKPRPPGQPAMTDPGSEGGGFGKLFKSLLNRPKLGPAPKPDSRMGLGKNRTDQRILQERRTVRPAVIPLPEEASDGHGVNLLGEELTRQFNLRERLMRLGMWALGGAAAVGLAWAGLAWATRSVTSQINVSKAELTQVQDEIRNLQSDVTRVAATTRKLGAIRNLINRHVRWTRFFALLEQYTLPEVFYGPAFSGDIQGALTLSASADTYERVAQQYLVFQTIVERGDFIRSFDISGATRRVGPEGPRIGFSISLQVLPAVFENPSAAAGQPTPLRP